MAFKLEREKTQTTPYVLIDEEKAYLKLEGVSYLEDIMGFFKEINEWLERYLASTESEGGSLPLLTFDCEMAYFNSSTTKQLFNMLILMDKHSSGERKVVVNWICEKDDEMGLEHGEDIRDEMQHLIFNLVEK